MDGNDNDNDSPTVPPPSDNGTTESDIEPLEPHNNDDVGNVDIDEIGSLDSGSPEELDSSQANEIVRQSADAEVLK